MSEGTSDIPPNQYFSDIIYNPSNFTSTSSGLTIEYANQHYLHILGTPTSSATYTTFTGDVQVDELVTDNIQGVNASDSISLYNASTGTINLGSATNNVVIGNILDISGNVVCSENVTVGGNTTVDETLTVTGATQLSSLTTTGNTAVDGTLTISDATQLSSLTTTGNTAVDGTLTVGGNTTLDETLTVTGATQLSSLTTTGKK
jgi:hypothetical protein